MVFILFLLYNRVHLWQDLSEQFKGHLVSGKVETENKDFSVTARDKAKEIYDNILI